MEQTQESHVTVTEYQELTDEIQRAHRYAVGLNKVMEDKIAEVNKSLTTLTSWQAKLAERIERIEARVNGILSRPQQEIEPSPPGNKTFSSPHKLHLRVFENGNLTYTFVLEKILTLPLATSVIEFSSIHTLLDFQHILLADGWTFVGQNRIFTDSP